MKCRYCGSQLDPDTIGEVFRGICRGCHEDDLFDFAGVTREECNAERAERRAARRERA